MASATIFTLAVFSFSSLAFSLFLFYFFLFCLERQTELHQPSAAGSIRFYETERRIARTRVSVAHAENIQSADEETVDNGDGGTFFLFEIRFGFCPIGKQTLKWFLCKWKLIISVFFSLQHLFLLLLGQPVSVSSVDEIFMYSIDNSNRSNISLDKMELRDARQLISIRLIFNAFFKFNKTCFDFHLFCFVCVCLCFCWLLTAAAYLFLTSTNENKKSIQPIEEEKSNWRRNCQ